MSAAHSTATGTISRVEDLEKFLAGKVPVSQGFKHFLRAVSLAVLAVSATFNGLYGMDQGTTWYYSTVLVAGYVVCDLALSIFSYLFLSQSLARPLSVFSGVICFVLSCFAAVSFLLAQQYTNDPKKELIASARQDLARAQQEYDNALQRQTVLITQGQRVNGGVITLIERAKAALQQQNKRLAGLTKDQVMPSHQIYVLVAHAINSDYETVSLAIRGAFALNLTLLAAALSGLTGRTVTERELEQEAARLKRFAAAYQNAQQQLAAEEPIDEVTPPSDTPTDTEQVDELALKRSERELLRKYRKEIKPLFQTGEWGDSKVTQRALKNRCNLGSGPALSVKGWLTKDGFIADNGKPKSKTQAS